MLPGDKKKRFLLREATYMLSKELVQVKNYHVKQT
jgi:hypothetical protein